MCAFACTRCVVGKIPRGDGYVDTLLTISIYGLIPN